MTTGIAITAAEVISPAGRGIAPLWRAMATGKTCVRQRDSLPWPNAVIDPGLLAWPRGGPWADVEKYAGQATRWALAAALPVIERAGRAEPSDATRCGTVIAVGWSPDELDDALPFLTESGRNGRGLPEVLYDEAPAFSSIRAIPSTTGFFVSMASGFQGSHVVLNGDAVVGGMGAVALASRLIASDELDRVLVVGASTASSAGLAARHREEPFGSRARAGHGPFDVGRAGAFPGQAAAALMIERASTAQERDICPSAELLACETFCARTRAAAAYAVIASFEHQLAPDVWWAHGAGAPLTDSEECASFGLYAGMAPVTSSKGTIGLATECSALVDLALAVEALHRRSMPPTALLDRIDPMLGAVDPVLRVPRNVAHTRTALVTSLGPDPIAASAGAALLGRWEK
ncbi:beta-ketoacyl synthase N-terminal-like domain-containing protein [Streptomyces sp. NPDC005900]|uniref:beta-ketoacyl synthase N-terminal-like domain-containing protein n=1 Tax=Streptomyces sp. NPDC005900 TaxID=3154569 RepID=UPI0033DBDF93